jgi:hypothetical protein
MVDYLDAQIEEKHTTLEQAQFLNILEESH